MKGAPPAVFLQGIITTMFVLLLTRVSAENMETFNKNWTTGMTGGNPFTATDNTMETFLIPTAGLNHGGTEGLLIHTHPAMEITPLLGDQLMLSSATSLEVQAIMHITPTADAKSSTNVVGIITTNCSYQDDSKMGHNLNTTMTQSSSASAATAPINSTRSLASFTGKKGGEREDQGEDAKSDTATSLPLHPTKSGTKSSTTVAADKTTCTDKISTGINKILLIEDEPHEPTTTFTDVTRQLYPSLLRLLHWIAGLFIFMLSVLTMNFRNWRPCMPISLRKKKKLKIGKGNGNVSSNSMGKMLCGFLCVIALIMVTDANAAMKMDTTSSAVTLPITGRVVPDPTVPESEQQQEEQKGEEEELSRNVDSNEIFDLKLQLAALKNENGYLKVEVSRSAHHQNWDWKHRDDSIDQLTRELLAKCSVGSGATNQDLNQEERHLHPAESLVVRRAGDEARGAESSGTVCTVLQEYMMERSMKSLVRRTLVLGQETKVVSRGRRLVACDFKFSDELGSTGGWNVLSESCVLGSEIDVGSGKTMKVKKDPSVSGPVVIDRQATSGNSRHFLVNGGNLEMEGITLKGGYAVSFISSNILLLII